MEALMLLIESIVDMIVGFYSLIPDTVLLAPFVFFLVINVVATLKMIVRT